MSVSGAPRGARMARRHSTRETLQSARKLLIIKEIQAAVARELGARSEVPKTMPQRIADLLRELHSRASLRELHQATIKPAYRVGGCSSTYRADSGGASEPCSTGSMTIDFPLRSRTTK